MDIVYEIGNFLLQMGKSKEEITALIESVIEISQKTRRSPEGLLMIVYDCIKSGMDKEQTIKQLKIACGYW